MKKLKEYVICCKDGIVTKSGQDGHMYWCWAYEDMDIYGKEKPSDLVQDILAKFLRDNYDLDFELIFRYVDKTMQEELKDGII